MCAVSVRFLLFFYSFVDRFVVLQFCYIFDVMGFAVVRVVCVTVISVFLLLFLVTLFCLIIKLCVC